MRTLVILAFGMMMSSQVFAAVPTCVINGTRRLLPADVGSKDLSFHVANSAGARMALIKSNGPTSLVVSSDTRELQNIGLYRSDNETDEKHIHCFSQNDKQICTMNTDGTPRELPTQFEIDGTKFEVSVQNGVRFIKIETNRALDISSTSGDDFSQRFSVFSQQRKLNVNCAAVKIKRVETQYQQFAGCGTDGC